jgi:hypothetical protein
MNKPAIVFHHGMTKVQMTDDKVIVSHFGNLGDTESDFKNRFKALIERVSMLMPSAAKLLEKLSNPVDVDGHYDGDYVATYELTSQVA